MSSTVFAISYYVALTIHSYITQLKIQGVQNIWHKISTIHGGQKQKREHSFSLPVSPLRLQAILQVTCYSPPLHSSCGAESCGQDRSKPSPDRAQLSKRLLEPADVQDGLQSCLQGKFRFKAGAPLLSPHFLQPFNSFQTDVFTGKSKTRDQG